MTTSTFLDRFAPGWSAFYRTQLYQHLRDRDITTLVVADEPVALRLMVVHHGVMPFDRRMVATTLTAAGMTSALLGAPIASASGADAIIADLQGQGYNVQINWLNGFDTKPLSTCTVTNVNNPDHSGAPMTPGDTIYVDVRCPNNSDDDGTGDFGIGIVIG